MVVLTQPWPQGCPVPTRAWQPLPTCSLTRAVWGTRANLPFTSDSCSYYFSLVLHDLYGTRLLDCICVSPNLSGTPVAWAEKLFKDLEKLALTFQRDHRHPGQNWGEGGAFWAAESPGYTVQGCAMITRWAGKRDSSAGFLVPLISLAMSSLNWHI